VCGFALSYKRVAVVLAVPSVCVRVCASSAWHLATCDLCFSEEKGLWTVEYESHCCECRGERWCGLPLSTRVTVVSAEVVWASLEYESHCCECRGGVGFP
jgi:hypothetical protein